MQYTMDEERFDELCDKVSELALEVAALAKIVQKLEEQNKNEGEMR